MEIQNKILLFGLIFLTFISCRVKKSEQKQSHLEINERVQAVSIATKQIDRLVLRLDSMSLTIAQFDTLGRITSLTTAKQGTRTETKEQETAQDSVRKSSVAERVEVSEVKTDSETKAPFAVPSAFWWVLGGVVLLLIIALVIRVLKR